MATLRHLAHWLAWQLSDHRMEPTHPPARITLFPADD
jgi:hypothetical protein